MALAAVFDQGASPDYGTGKGKATAVLTYDAACTAAGDVVDLSERFSTIRSIKFLGVTTTGMTGYVPQAFFTADCAAATGVTVRMMVQDGDAGLLVGATDDLSAVGSIKIEVTGALATS